MNHILNTMVAAFRVIVLWAARNHPDEAEAMVGDIVYGLLTTPTFKKIWRLSGRPHVAIRITPNDVIDIRALGKTGARTCRISTVAPN